MTSLLSGVKELRTIVKELNNMADSAEQAKEIWEAMSIEKVVGKKNIDIRELEEGIVIAIDKEA